MKKIWIVALLTSLSLGACVKISEATPAPTAILFVTATLPPTRLSFSLPTDTPTAAPDASTTEQTPGTPDETAGSISAAGACTDSAVMIQDVTVPDNAIMSKGEK